MIGIVLFIVGILAALIGLAISIALHECGHLYFAKRFGLRVPQYMVGFGPTIWSRRRGETEYGVKLLPLGGYISMIGMYPPKSGKRANEQSTGFFSRMVEDGRQASAESIPEGEEHRAFYRLPVWKRMLIMLGGPAMNFVLAAIIFAFLGSVIGVYQPSTKVGEVYQCVVSAADRDDPDAATNCETPAPGAQAGLKPGDQITAVNGQEIGDWQALQDRIRVAADTPLTLSVVRDGKSMSLTVTPRANEVYVTDPTTGRILEDEQGRPRTQTVGFVGFTPQHERTRRGLDFVGEMYHQNLSGVINVIVTMPQRVVEMFQAGFLGAERDPYGPMSVVGVGRVTGEIVSQDAIPVLDRVTSVIQIVGSLNIMLGAMNLIPLPPLDGGHIAAAGWDGLRHWWARIRRRPEPEPFDAAKLLPVTMVVAVLLMAIGALFIFTDLVNPIQLFK